MGQISTSHQRIQIISIKIDMTSLTFQDNDNDNCFTSCFGSTRRSRNQRLEQHTLSQQISLKKGMMALKNQEKNKIAHFERPINIKTAQKEAKNDGHLKQTASGTKNGQMSTTRRIVNVKLDYSHDNCEVGNEGSRHITIEEVESQDCRQSQASNIQHHCVISQSEIIHNYFDSHHHIKATSPCNKSDMLHEEPKKIKRLFKTQRNS